MVDFKRLTSKARELVERRGGTDALKEDAAELKDIATGSGSTTDKAKAAAEAIKEPGAAGPQASETEAAAGREGGAGERGGAGGHGDDEGSAREGGGGRRGDGPGGAEGGGEERNRGQG